MGIQKIADDINALTIHPVSTDEYSAGYQAARHDAWLIAQEAADKNGEVGISEDQIKHMVQRFLGWKLPQNFSPDGGISFKQTFNEHTDHPMVHEPSGTNLLDVNQAEMMVRHMLEGLPPSA